MLKKLFVFLILGLTLGLFSVSSAQARIYILIDEASNNKFPIAVPDFLTSSGGKSGAGSKYADLLIKDLSVAGIFNVLDESKFPSDDRDVDHIDFSKLKALDAQALVKGVVSGSKLELRLYDVAEQKMVLGKQYTINAKNYADAVHRFTDSLMKELTGTRGPFESKIAASCGHSFKRTIAASPACQRQNTGFYAFINLPAMHLLWPIVWIPLIVFYVVCTFITGHSRDVHNMLHMRK